MIFLSLYFLLQRMTIPQILESDWFRKDYKPPHFEQGDDVSLDDVDAVFTDSAVSFLHISVPLVNST